jgi:hypothetical protein
MEAWGFEPLSDLKLNAITAGNTSTDQISADSLMRIPLHYSGKNASVDGELIVIPLYNSYEASSLQLSDNAQSNLRSLININAVNSPIQVLLNLNINVNSNIQQIKQLNTLLSD